MTKYAQRRVAYAKERLQQLQAGYSVTGKNWEQSAKAAVEQAARVSVVLEDLIKEMEAAIEE